MDKVIDWWRNTKEMPFLLKMICQGCMVTSPIFMFLLIVPVSEWTVNGKLMSYTELWQSGAGLTFAVLEVFVGIGSWGMAARRSVYRWALVVAPAASFLTMALFSSLPWHGFEAISLTVLGQLLLLMTVIYFPLFHVPAVNRYFEKEKNVNFTSA